ncbi:PaaI family thioesterase [Microbacterium suaedae]|uniref:PaaI family thioesterase n=1 Tax=Microbacterium suaedae TaxID=2067813 RepID=UPI0013A67F5D|nr:PaaI family thioesterase [Microbacterium suaedae]
MSSTTSATNTGAREQVPLAAGPQPVEDWLGATVESQTRGEAILVAKAERRHLNAAGFVHGGVLFAIADCALARAAILPQAGATTWAHISFISPARLGEELVAVARATTEWGANALVDVTVRVGESVVAEFRGQARQLTQ